MQSVCWQAREGGSSSSMSRAAAMAAAGRVQAWNRAQEARQGQYPLTTQDTTSCCWTRAQN